MPIVFVWGLVYISSDKQRKAIIMKLSGRERILRTMNRQPVDRYPVFEHFWPDTHKRWLEKGWIKESDDLSNLLGLEIRGGGWLNGVADLDFVPRIIAEDEQTITVLDGNGATLRRHKKHDATPEHVAFSVTDREGWEKSIKPHLLKLDERRIPFESYREARKGAAERGDFFVWTYVGPFEQIHPICGHENMLMGMLEDPEWVAEMAEVLTDFSIRHAEALFAREGEPDGIWLYEDMGYKFKPFMSPEHYRELIQPGHRKLCDWAHGKGKKVIMHSCGFVEPLLEGMVEAGIDCLQAIEVKAGMDLVRIARNFKDRIAFCGGMDIREFYVNDRNRIDQMLESVLRPLVDMGASYIIHSDHSIPPEVDLDTLRYFEERAKEMSTKA